MAGLVSTGTTTIDFGSRLRIGYKAYGSDGPFTYLTEIPTYDELPYVFSLPAGVYNIQYAEVCPTCTLPSYSNAVETVVTVL